MGARASSYEGARDATARAAAAFLRQHGQTDAAAARAAWEGERAEYAAQAGAAGRERDALGDGMELWEEAMETVGGFERRLKARIRDGAGKDVVADEMHRVVDGLEDMVQRATREGWNLLVVAISNELQAYKEACEVLERSMRGSVLSEGSRGRRSDDRGSRSEDSGRRTGFRPPSEDGHRRARASEDENLLSLSNDEITTHRSPRSPKSSRVYSPMDD